MKATCIFGPHDGEEIKAEGYQVLFPMSDTQHAEEHHRWFKKWGVVHAIAMAWNIEYKGEYPPKFPYYVYQWAKTEYDRVFLVYAGLVR